MGDYEKGKAIGKEIGFKIGYNKALKCLQDYINIVLEGLYDTKNHDGFIGASEIYDHITERLADNWCEEAYIDYVVEEQNKKWEN